MALRKHNVNELDISMAGKAVRVTVRPPRPSDMIEYFGAQGADWDIYSARVALGRALITDVREGDIEYESRDGWAPLSAKVEGWKDILADDHFPLLAAVGFFFEKQLQPIPQALEGTSGFFGKSSQSSKDE